MITKKELKAQLAELERMLCIELFPTKLIRLGQEHILKENILEKVLNSDSSALSLLTLLKSRSEHAQKQGCKLERIVDGISQPTALNNIVKGVTDVHKLMIDFHHIEELSDLQSQYFNAITSSLFMLAYSAGAHDTEISMERHCLNGYKDKITKPFEKGLRNAENYEPIKCLVAEMTDFYNKNEIGYTSKAQLAEAIFSVLRSFSSTGNNRNLKALKVYKNGYPSARKLQEYISTSFDSSKSKSLTKLTLSKIESLIHQKFRPEIILKKLNS